MQSIQQALIRGTQHLAGISTEPRRDAELLLLRLLNADRAFLLTHPAAMLTDQQTAQYESWLKRRAAHEPIQYIVGEQEFYGLRFEVTPDVLIPRPETEHLVETLLERVSHRQPLRIADIGTGSGAIAVTLAHTLPLAQITALDLSSATLQTARKNAERHQVADRVRFLQSDLLNAVHNETFDAIVSNPPYVPEADRTTLEPQVRDYEPSLALFAGQDGLDIYRRLIPEAYRSLEPDGWLLMEIGHGQREALAELLSGWRNVQFVDDLQGIPRVACARRKA